MRLKVERVEDVENDVEGWVSPTPVQDWRRYLLAIRHPDYPRWQLVEPLLGNLSHRLQLAEFEAALLLCDYDARNLERPISALHETVKRFKIHQFVTLIHSVFEGLGSHFLRAERDNRNARIQTRQWRRCLSRIALSYDEGLHEQTVLDAIGEITTWRDRIHLDRLATDQGLHFNGFDYEDVFLPTYETFQMVMEALNPDWPEGTVLGEH